MGNNAFRDQESNTHSERHAQDTDYKVQRSRTSIELPKTTDHLDLNEATA